MLPPAARMRRKDDFALTVRTGRRASRGGLVVHYLAPPADADTSALVGFVVGRGVGNSVQRHRVLRQLRHLMRDRLPWLPYGAMVVVRAQQGVAGRESADLGRYLDVAFGRLGVLPAVPS